MGRIFFCILKVTKKEVGSGSGFRGTDPHQKMTDPQHCFFVACYLWSNKQKSLFFVGILKPLTKKSRSRILIWIRVIQCTDPRTRIRIRYKISRIRNTDQRPPYHGGTLRDQWKSSLHNLLRVRVPWVAQHFNFLCCYNNSAFCKFWMHMLKKLNVLKYSAKNRKPTFFIRSNQFELPGKY